MKMAEKVVIGNAELWHGDCREVLPLLAVHDLLLTDPPYGFGQGIVNVGECPAYADSYAWNDAPPDDDLIVLALQAAKQQIVCGGNYFPMLWAKPARGFIVWDKMQCSDKHADAELIWTSFDRNAKLYRYCFSGNRYGWEARCWTRSWAAVALAWRACSSGWRSLASSASASISTSPASASAAPRPRARCCRQKKRDSLCRRGCCET
jgi:hypothetical protein